MSNSIESLTNSSLPFQEKGITRSTGLLLSVEIQAVPRSTTHFINIYQQNLASTVLKSSLRDGIDNSISRCCHLHVEALMRCLYVLISSA